MHSSKLRLLKLAVAGHGKDGRAATEKGRAVRATDLTSEKTQSKSDAELFRAISRGVRGTAMPAFAKTHKPAEIWQIILFLRKLPTLRSGRSLRRRCRKERVTSTAPVTNTNIPNPKRRLITSIRLRRPLNLRPLNINTTCRRLSRRRSQRSLSTSTNGPGRSTITLSRHRSPARWPGTT